MYHEKKSLNTTANMSTMCMTAAGSRVGFPMNKSQLGQSVSHNDTYEIQGNSNDYEHGYAPRTRRAITNIKNEISSIIDDVESKALWRENVICSVRNTNQELLGDIQNSQPPNYGYLSGQHHIRETMENNLSQFGNTYRQSCVSEMPFSVLMDQTTVFNQSTVGRQKPWSNSSKVHFSPIVPPSPQNYANQLQKPAFLKEALNGEREMNHYLTDKYTQLEKENYDIRFQSQECARLKRENETLRRTLQSIKFRNNFEDSVLNELEDLKAENRKLRSDTITLIQMHN